MKKLLVLTLVMLTASFSAYAHDGQNTRHRTSIGCEKMKRGGMLKHDEFKKCLAEAKLHAVDKENESTKVPVPTAISDDAMDKTWK